ncbi:MAG: LCP family protein [Lachnospiraceae bacterium]
MKKKKGSKVRIYGRILLGILLVISIGVGAGYGYITTKLDSRQSSLQSEDVEIDPNIPLVFDSDIVNILLLGIDERPEEGDGGRSDTCMIATIDFKNKELKLTSLMRDMYVDIPGHATSKFNAAYADGGIPLVIQTIAQNFGIRVDGYATVNFEAFVEVVNRLGGVRININEDEYNWIQANCKRRVLLKIKPGKQKLNGDQALLYSRLRFVGNNDYERTDRQRRVLTKLYKKFKNQSYSEMLSLVLDILPYINTDLSSKEIQSLLYNVLKMNIEDVQQLRLPVDGAYYDDMVYIGGYMASVLQIDVEANKEALQTFIYGPPAVTEEGLDTVTDDGMTSTESTAYETYE